MYLGMALIRPSLICLTVGLLTACSSVAEPFESANLGMVPDSSPNAAVTPEEAALNTTARAALAFPSPAQIVSTQDKPVQKSAPSQGTGPRATEPQKKITTDVAPAPRDLAKEFEQFQSYAKPAVNAPLSQLYFDHPDPNAVAMRAAARAADYRGQPTGKIEQASLRTNNTSENKLAPLREPSRLMHFSYLLFALGALLIAGIFGVASAGYRMELARLAKAERQEMRKRRKLWVKKLGDLPTDDDTTRQ